MKTIDPIDSAYLTIAAELQSVEEILIDAVSSCQVSIIKEAAQHTISGGGKRLRPALSILSAKICGGYNESVLYLCAAIELIHTASLIHDDVLDEAELRRGLPSAKAIWGNHLSILVGDYCLSMASKLLSRYSNSKIISIITEAALKTTEGEALETIYRNNISTGIDSYIKVIGLKTACLMEAACETGSMIAEAPERLTENLKNYGKNIGIAFQIADDIMDYVSPGNSMGKPKGADLRSGKLTLPLIFSLHKCSSHEKDTIKEALLANNEDACGFDDVVKILEKYGCISESIKKCEEYILAAEQSISTLRPSLEKDALINLARFIVPRKY